MCSPFVLAKGIMLYVLHFLCKRNALLRVGRARDRFEYKITRNCPFRVCFCDCEVPTRSSAATVQVPRFVQRQNSGRA